MKRAQLQAGTGIGGPTDSPTEPDTDAWRAVAGFHVLVQASALIGACMSWARAAWSKLLSNERGSLDHTAVLWHYVIVQGWSA